MIRIILAIWLLILGVIIVLLDDIPRSSEEQKMEDEAQIEFLKQWREKQKKSK